MSCGKGGKIIKFPPSMEQPVIIKFKWTLEDMLEGYRYHFRHVCRPLFRFLLHFIFALILLGGLIAFFKGAKDSLIVSLGFIFVGVYWFVFRRFERRWIIRRQFAKRPDQNREVEWEIGAEKLAVRSSVGHSEFGWEALIKVVRTPSSILLYSLEQYYHLLPRRGFASDAEFERLWEIAQSKVKRHYVVT